MNLLSIKQLCSRLYLPAVFILIIYPIFLSIGTYFYIKYFSFGWFEFILIVVSYYTLNITVGVGLHRYWSHAAFKLNKTVEAIFALLAAATLQGPILMWASDHTKHHSYTDTPKDPHSPLNFGGGFKGFLWSHIGWMLVRSGPNKDIDRGTVKKLSRNAIVMLQFKYYWYISIFMNTVVPISIGFLCLPSYKGAIAGFVFLGIGRALQQQLTFCINSVTHYFGTKQYENGTAGDIWWMAPFLLGENWHNFHHAFPTDYRNGNKWYHFDVHKWVIYLLKKCKLASDLNITNEIRIISQRKFVLENSFNDISSRWFSLKKKVDEWNLNYFTKSTDNKNNLESQCNKCNEKLSEIAQSIKNLIDSQDLSKKVISQITILLKLFEENVINLEKQIPLLQ